MNTSKETCGVIFSRCLKKLTDGETNPVKLFCAGHLTGNAEKIYLGACLASMSRPSPEYHEWLLQCAIVLSSEYGLEVTMFERPEIAEEIWIHKPEAKNSLTRLTQLEYNSLEWHCTRGWLCGIPIEDIDPEFHLRRGFREPADRV